MSEASEITRRAKSNLAFALRILPRERWDDYQRAYQDAIAATGTAWAPWVIVPADSKTHRNLMVATVLKAALQGLGLRFPPLPEQLKGAKVPFE